MTTPTAMLTLKAALEEYLKTFLTLEADTPEAIAAAEAAFLDEANTDDRIQYLYAKSTLLGLQAAIDAALPPTTRTETIEGIEISLIPGRTYFASRPMAGRGVASFPVTIADANGKEVFTTPPLSYGAANRFMARFAPNGIFGGLVW